MDILPTLLDLLGMDVPGHMQGMSMAALARGAAGSAREYVFGEKNYTNYYDPSRMVRTREFKYIRKGLRTCIFDFLIPEIEGAAASFRHPDIFTFYSSRRTTEELYDLGLDPGELRNLAGDPTYSETQDALHHALGEHLLATDDPFREVRNGLLMPADEYAPAMAHMMRRFASAARRGPVPGAVQRSQPGTPTPR